MHKFIYQPKTNKAKYKKFLAEVAEAILEKEFVFINTLDPKELATDLKNDFRLKNVTYRKVGNDHIISGYYFYNYELVL